MSCERLPAGCLAISGGFFLHFGCAAPSDISSSGHEGTNANHGCTEDFAEDRDLPAGNISDGSPHSSKEEGSPIGTQSVDYAPLERVQDRRRRGAVYGTPQFVDIGSGLACGGTPLLLQTSVRPPTRSVGFRTSTQPRSMQVSQHSSQPSVLVYTNPVAQCQPARNTEQHRRSYRLSAQTRLSQGTTVEDITAIDPPVSAVEVQSALEDFRHIGSEENHRQPGRPAAANRVRKRKNDNWTDLRSREALAVFDGGMSMKEASEKFHIPYTSFRDQCLKKSRHRGGRSVLTLEEESKLVDWLI